MESNGSLQTRVPVMAEVLQQILEGAGHQVKQI